MRLLLFPILLFLVFVPFSCKKESFVPEEKEPVIVEDIPCEDIRIPGEFKLDSVLKAEFCYLKNPFSKLIFVDSLGFETKLDFDTIRSGVSLSGAQLNCETSQTSNQIILWNSEFVSIALVDSVTNDIWSLSLSRSPDLSGGQPFQSSQVFRIRFQENGGSGNLSLFNINLETFQNSAKTLRFFDEIELNSKFFEDVFYREVKYRGNILELYFNFEYGLIAYTSIDGERLMILDKIE
ncbi:MAG: hypothetical protein R2879_15640 [Saprospiraceae bacterium]